MEARRLERRRRDSAKNIAAPMLPSSQDQDFHLRLIDLYRQHACLWNTSLNEHQDTKLKREAWDDIASKLGSHLTASFVRSRISSLRYRLNVYKLQMLEYKMSPSYAKKPEKHYYIDNFDFLDTVIHSQEQKQKRLSECDRLDDDTTEWARKSNLSIASIFKQRIKQQGEMPNVLQRLSITERGKTANFNFNDYSDLSIASVVKKRMQQQPPLDRQAKSEKNSIIGLPKFRESLLNTRLLLQQTQKTRKTAHDKSAGVTEMSTHKSHTTSHEIDDMLRKRMHRLSLIEQDKDSPLDSLDDASECRDSRLNIPSVVKKRMRQQFSLRTLNGLDLERISSKSFSNLPDSMLNIPQDSSALRALPGDSVSKTKMTKCSIEPKTIDLEESKEHSDDDDLYRLHWSVRQQKRSRRPAGMVPSQDFRSQPLPFLLLGNHSKLDTNMEYALEAKL
ncbi:uncharacterized protein LOC117789908 [Drosophila innubila]|uniref:uncharacterized protein LOC117789908 n=1 Tax=Drosophila innubila TaxID=198719 RepID=UPI00148DF6EC|nr:uncharacterized protein LOC117789908 [Drosophila innubila]